MGNFQTVDSTRALQNYVCRVMMGNFQTVDRTRALQKYV